MLDKLGIRDKRILALVLAIACLLLLLIVGHKLTNKAINGDKNDYSTVEDNPTVKPDDHLSHRQQLRLERIARLEREKLTDNKLLKKIVGYYAGWAAYKDYTPLFIDGSKVSHINYAFANISEDLLVEVGDPEVDIDNFRDMQTLKEYYPHLKTLISIGGWTWSGRFSDAALTAESRDAFAESSVEFILKYGFDGIDLDWEYPVAGGLTGNKVRPEDRGNFTALIKAIREKLDKQSAEDGREYLLTIAGAISSDYMNNTEMVELSKHLDYINIMTYDINGPWDHYNDFNAALYPHDKKGKAEQWSVSQGIELYLGQGIPAAKLVMGVPFYGYKYELKNRGSSDDDGLLAAFSQGEYVEFGHIDKEFSNRDGFKRYWEESSRVPWLYNGKTFITYDDEKSMAEKAEYAIENNLGGLMIWELSNDPENVLLDAINEVFSSVKDELPNSK